MWYEGRLRWRGGGRDRGGLGVSESIRLFDIDDQAMTLDNAEQRGLPDGSEQEYLNKHGRVRHRNLIILKISFHFWTV